GSGRAGETGQYVGDLLAADVERADRHGAPVHAFQQRAERGELLILTGQIVAIHVEELAAHEAKTGSTRGNRLVEFARQFEIGLEHDLDVVARYRRQPAQLVELTPLVAQLFPPL